MTALAWQMTKQAPAGTTRERFFFLGNMGTGKTLAAASFDEPFWIQPYGENSVNTLKKHGIEVPHLVIGAPGVSVIGEIYNLLNELLAVQKRDPNMLPGQTIVWDGLSHLGDAIVSEVAAGNKKDPGEMNQRLWGDVREVWNRIQQISWQLDCHVILIAHPLVETSQGTGQITFAGPRIQGSAKQSLPASCDHIAYFDVLQGDGEKRPDVYRTFFKPFSGFPARTRGKLPREILGGFDFQKVKHLL